MTKCVCAEDLTVHFLDVGQGLCIYAESGDESLLYDGGGRDSSSFVVSYLKQQNVEKIDYLICSHFDEDHMAGLIGCLHAFEVGSVILPEYQKESDLFNSLMSAIAEKQLAVHYAYAGEEYSFGEGEFRVLGPARIVEKDNNNSVCIQLRKGNQSFLFTGDAEFDEESDIVAMNSDVESSVYCAGHHGSASSTSDDLLAAARPEAIIISCGTGNSYGHPHEEMLSRLERVGIDIYRTDLQGTILAVTDGNEIFWNQDPCNDYSGGYETRSMPWLEEESEENEQDYVLNINSKKIHTPSCRAVTQMSDKNKEFYHGAIEELLFAGYVRCHECNAQQAGEITEPGDIQVDNIPDNVDYIANMGTKKFHYPDCSSADDIKESNRYYFTGSREELIEQGYQPCKRCYP